MKLSLKQTQYELLVAQSCLILYDPTDCSLPDSSVHEILQARILEWVAIPFSRGSSQPRSPALQADTLPAQHLWNFHSSSSKYHSEK